MIRRLFRAIFLAGLVAGGIAVVKAVTRKDDPLPRPAAAPRGEPWPPLRNESPAPDEVEPIPPPTEAGAADDEQQAVVAPEPGGVPVADTASGAARRSGRRTRPLEGATTWVAPTDDGTCPEGYPVKANLKSNIFHQPGQLNYDRTVPDRCYADPVAAEADGLRAAKR